MTQNITVQTLLQGYASGVFPMAESREDDELFWVDPTERGIFELESFHISRSLAKRIRQQPFEMRVNTAFMQVVQGCGAREETWINAPLLRLYQELHDLGHAHSQEVWDDGELVGGVYGLTIGAAFFGESMFSTRTDASKIALAYLMARLRIGGFTLFDTQFITAHLASLGAVEISRSDYRNRLKSALNLQADFMAQGTQADIYSVLQRNTQTS